MELIMIVMEVGAGFGGASGKVIGVAGGVCLSIGAGGGIGVVEGVSGKTGGIEPTVCEVVVERVVYRHW